MRKEISTLRRIAGEVKDVRKSVEQTLRAKYPLLPQPIDTLIADLTRVRDWCLMTADGLEAEAKSEVKNAVRKR